MPHNVKHNFDSHLTVHQHLKLYLLYQ